MTRGSPCILVATLCCFVVALAPARVIADDIWFMWVKHDVYNKKTQEQSPGAWSKTGDAYDTSRECRASIPYLREPYVMDNGARMVSVGRDQAVLDGPDFFIMIKYRCWPSSAGNPS